MSIHQRKGGNTEVPKTDAERALAALARKGDQLIDAERRENELRAETYSLVVDAVLAGAPKAAVARASGLTRQTVYTVLLKAGVASTPAAA